MSNKPYDMLSLMTSSVTEEMTMCEEKKNASRPITFFTDPVTSI